MESRSHILQQSIIDIDQASATIVVLKSVRDKKSKTIEFKSLIPTEAGQNVAAMMDGSKKCCF